MTEYSTGGMIPTSTRQDAVEIHLTIGELIAYANGHFSEVQAAPGGYVIVRITTDEQAAANVANRRKHRLT